MSIIVTANGLCEIDGKYEMLLTNAELVLARMILAGEAETT